MKSPKEIAKSGRVVILGDLHFPAHDKRAWNLALNIIADLQPDAVGQIGDLNDFQAVSSHPRDFGTRFDLERDLRVGQDNWQLLEAAAGDALMFVTLGNHDRWLWRYVAKNAPAVEGLIPDFKALMGMSEDVIVRDYQQPFNIGPVQYVHDLGHCGKMAAEQTLEAAGQCVVFGHSHHAKITYSGDTNGNRRFAMNVGWLGDVSKITYMPAAKTRTWQQGIGIVDYDGGVAYASFVPFVKGRALVNNKLYR